MKYSRETRITFQTDFDLGSCKDILKFFPDIEIEESDLRNKMVKLVDKQIWWVMEQYFILPDPFGTKLQFSVNLSYRNFTEGFYGNVIPQDKSEVSLRIWAPDDGLQPWNIDILKKFDALYYKAVNILDPSCD